MGEVLTPGNVIVAAIVLAALFAGGRRALRGIAGTSSCCGDREGASRVRRVTVADTDEASYAYRMDLPIGGMTCESCAKRVADALNGVAGTWATVDLAKGMAHVRSKDPIDEGAYEAAVKAAGYHVQKL
ncbi:MAG: heavy-metal-associated domain-containing protein [Coriobacteriaceae bacterium]|nr:heavy-metal-associated domain-containing protein [Coriobacteriaceae bacterium]